MLKELKTIETILDKLVCLFGVGNVTILLGGMTIQEIIFGSQNPIFAVVMLITLTTQGFGYLYLSSQNCKEILKLELNE